MNEDLSLKFVSTYYKLLFSSSDRLHQFYDRSARISRPSGTFTLSDRPLSDLLPFDPKSSTVKIFDSNYIFLIDCPNASVITVYGSLGDCPFTQRFSLVLHLSRWFIVDDSLFSFDFEGEEPIGAEAGSIKSVPRRARVSQAADFDQSPDSAATAPTVVKSGGDAREPKALGRYSRGASKS
jgi:hypothetical protein